MKSGVGEREPSEDETLNLHVDVRARNESHEEAIRRLSFTHSEMFSSFCASNTYLFIYLFFNCPFHCSGDSNRLIAPLCVLVTE